MGTIYGAPTSRGIATNNYARGDILRPAEMTVGAPYMVPLHPVE
jgi:hypothetical protein